MDFTDIIIVLVICVVLFFVFIWLWPLDPVFCFFIELCLVVIASICVRHLMTG
ncbi:MAG: hypothetical protein NTZ13_00825 [Candidatus Parcubacteria bacterium]|nr:hypothetical protein [Candidatus Parcubacteria bacterium]